MELSSMNPYLPLDEYVPDAEPRLFEGRLYVYGSHDYAGGEKGFCPGDYVVWSADPENLAEWTFHGVSFSRTQCPELAPDDAMAAPDVVQGPDGRYYLYWNTNAQKVCRVAVSDSPNGPFAYYGEVCRPDGTPYDDWKMFDPGVLVDEDGRVYLYIGFCMPGPVPERFKKMKSPFADSSLGFELAADMKTIVRGPIEILPGANVAEGTGFEGHAFYEASSPRKINGKYVMVYSTEQSHELAYALSDSPLGKYSYAGVLVSNGDFGISSAAPVMPYGNVHGGLVRLKGDWYVFYHRQTHGIECCRQGCAEKLPIRSDGWFAQAEITSCGLNGKPLPAEGEYNACYCCHLTSSQISPQRLTIRECRRESEPHIYEQITEQDGQKYQHYIANILDDATVGYKYFQFDGTYTIFLNLFGEGKTVVSVHLDAPDTAPIACATAQMDGNWKSVELSAGKITGKHALYFTFQNELPLNFKSFEFRKVKADE